MGEELAQKALPGVMNHNNVRIDCSLMTSLTEHKNSSLQQERKKKYRGASCREEEKCVLISEEFERKQVTDSVKRK